MTEVSGDFPSDDEDTLFLLAEKDIIAKPGPGFKISDSFKMPVIRGRQYNQLFKSRYTLQSAIVRSMLKAYHPNVKNVLIGELLKNERVEVQEPEKKSLWSVPKPSTSKRSSVFTSKSAYLERIVIIGTVIKNQGTLPLVREYANLETRKPSEEIYLEDNGGKVEIVFTEDLKSVKTRIINGLVCAMFGKMDLTCRFVVDDLLFPQPKSSLFQNPKFDFKMIFVSGLHHKPSKVDMLDKVFKMLYTYAGNTNHLNEMMVVFVGNSWDVETLPINEQCEAFAQLDERFAELAKIAHVFLVPGLKDPTMPMLPQTPVHKAVIPESFCQDKFHSLTNPARMEVLCQNSDRYFEMLLCSGEISNDVMRSSLAKNCKEAASLMLLFGHLCPTAPDTTLVRPDMPHDMLVIERAPSLFVLGNQAALENFQDGKTEVKLLPVFSDSLLITICTNDFTHMSIHIAPE